jgi:hypothetical protein
MKAQAWQRAREIYSKLWAEQKSYDVALQLGQAEYNLQQFASAAEFFEFGIRNAPAREPPEVLQRAQALLSEAKKKVGTLEVQVTQAKADVFLDAVPVGISPLSAPLFARPGHHSLRVELDGYEPVLESFTLSAGETRTIAIDLPKRGAGMTTAATSPASPGELSDPPPSAREPLPLWPAIAGGSVAVLGLGAFVGLRVAAGNDKDDAERLAKLHGSSGCSDAGSRADTCGEQSDAAEAYDQKINASNVSLAIGSAALVGTLVFYLWPRNGNEERVGKKSSGIQIGGMASSGAASVWASGTFE